jgi:hypothetical protein
MNYYLQIALREYNLSLSAGLSKYRWEELPPGTQSVLEERAFELELADFAATLLAEAQ